MAITGGESRDYRWKGRTDATERTDGRTDGTERNGLTDATERTYRTAERTHRTKRKSVSTDVSKILLLQPSSKLTADFLSPPPPHYNVEMGTGGRRGRTKSSTSVASCTFNIVRGVRGAEAESEVKYCRGSMAYRCNTYRKMTDATHIGRREFFRGMRSACFYLFVSVSHSMMCDRVVLLGPKTFLT